LTDRRLYLCTPDRTDLESFVAASIRGGVDVVQLRDKHLDDRRLVDRGQLVGSICRDLGVPFIMNDRPDLALEAGADGVHVGQDDATPASARRILGEDAIIGLSTHSVEQLESSLGEPVTYISAGPVVPTPTKPGRPGTGIDYASYATSVSSFPVFVTGGVTPRTVPGLVESGVRRFVVVRWLTQAADPQRAARALCQAIDDAIDRNAERPAGAAGC
jgi:thiamine-phosphate pyrophosphorylase